MWLAIDNQAIKDDFYGGGAVVFTYPLRPDAAGFRPLEEYSEAVQELFTYNPEKARELLAEAGYADGLKLNSVNVQDQVEQASIVQAYWADIGVDLQINVEEQVAWQAIGYGDEDPSGGNDLVTGWQLPRPHGVL